MSNSPQPERNRRLAAVLSHVSSRVIANQLHSFIQFIQDNPTAPDDEILRQLEDNADGTGLIECLSWMRDEFTSVGNDADEGPTPRARAERFADALNNVIEQLEEIRDKAASRVAGDVRDRLITIDVQQLAPAHIDDVGGPGLGPEPAATPQQDLV